MLCADDPSFGRIATFSIRRLNFHSQRLSGFIPWPNQAGLVLMALKSSGQCVRIRDVDGQPARSCMSVIFRVTVFANSGFGDPPNSRA